MFKEQYATLKLLTSKKIIPKRIAAFDIETENMLNGENRFLLGGIIDEYNEYHYFTDKEEMIDFLIGDKSAQNNIWKNTYIVATNLKFDFHALFYETKHYPKFHIIWNGSNMKMASFTFPRGNKVTFIDTMNYSPLSVASMGKILGIPKLNYLNLGKMPQNAQEWALMREYNRRDCEITKKYLEFIQKELNKAGGKLKITAPSSAMDIFRRKYLKHPIIHENIQKKEYNDLIFKSYYGGRTEVIKRGFIKNIKLYDFNSLYPSCMLNEYPTTNSAAYKRYPQADIIEYEGISSIILEAPYMYIPILPLRTEKLIFPYGQIKGVYTHIEIRKAQEHGYKIKRIEWSIYYRKTEPVFSDFIHDMYAKRQEKQAINDPTQTIYKLLMNSLYGKFGQKSMQEYKYIDLNDDSDHTADWKMLENDDINNNLDMFGKGYITKNHKCRSPYVIPIYASYTTAYARIKLWEIMQKYDGYYCDTDSIMTHKEILTSNKLGSLKLEKEIRKGIIIKPKSYYIMDDQEKEIVKLKGIPKADIKTFDDILRKKGVTYNKFSGVKESIRGGYLPNTVREQIKNVDLEDNKRRWKQLFNPYQLDPNSEPFKILGYRFKIKKYVKNINIRKAMEWWDKNKHQQLLNLLKSDLFDHNSYADDKLLTESYKDEIWAAIHD